MKLKQDKPEAAIITTYSGRHIDLLEPCADDIVIDDIAVALSRINRFTGHTHRPYTVAEHCLAGLEFCAAWHRLPYLMHDASEAYLGDVSGPLKRLLGMKFYRDLETCWTAVIAARFGLKANFASEVHAIDQRMLVTEQRDLLGRMPLSIDPYRPFNTRLPASAPPQELLQREFLDAFYQLSKSTEGARR